MCGTAWGESNSPECPVPECSGSKECGNPTRVTLAVEAGPLAGTGGVKREPIDTLGRRSGYSSGSGSVKRVRGERTEPRSRFSWEDPGRVETQGSIRRLGALITCRAARDSRKGQSPGAAARRDGFSFRWERYRREKRHVGPPGRKRRGDLARGERFEGWIPGAPSARNRADTGSEGVNRQEGSQTLKAERSGTWRPRGRWTSGPWCAEGKQSPREEPACCGRLARVRWVRL